MTRILVTPESLQSMGSQFERAANELLQIRNHLTSTLRGLDWETRQQVDVDSHVQTSARRAEALAQQMQSFAQLLKAKASAFHETDSQGVQDLQKVAAATRIAMPVALAPVLPLALLPVLGLGRILGPASLRDLADLVNRTVIWLKGVFGDIFGPPPSDIPPAKPEPSTPVPTPGSGTQPVDVVPPGPTAGEERLPTPEEVSFIQRVLGVEEDGYGPKTKAAVAKLQREHGIPVDADVKIGPKTWSTLMGIYSGSPSSDGGTSSGPNDLPPPSVPSGSGQEAAVYGTLTGDPADRYTNPGNSFYAEQHPLFRELANGALNRPESEQVLNAYFSEYLDIMRPTLNAEGSEWLRNCVGNFDGAGASVGMLQWNFKSGSLQPLLRQMAERHPELFHQVFRDSRAEALLDHMDDLGWVKGTINNGKSMVKDWAVDFDMLCATKEFQQIQLEFLNKEGSYWTEAQGYANEWGFTTRKGLAAVFNAHVQSGWFANDSDAIQVWERSTGLERDAYGSFGSFLAACRERVKGWDDTKKIELFRDVFAAQANPQWAGNVADRFNRILADTSIRPGPWH